MFPVSSDYDHLKPYIENEKKERLPVHEGDLFYLVDGYFKGKQNEESQREEKESGQDDKRV
jgi:hypothetical protein